MSINIINKLEKKCLYVEIVVLDKRKSNELVEKLKNTIFPKILLQIKEKCGKINMLNSKHTFFLAIGECHYSSV